MVVGDEATTFRNRFWPQDSVLREGLVKKELQRQLTAVSPVVHDADGLGKAS
jgi:hypothetical protein